ncbi:MAG: tyrosine-type recombinase/integrase [Candidatus Sulfotelmatobacter sp.]|jgi:integrase
MAKSKVGLYLRFRTPEGKQSPNRPVAWDSKKRLRPGWCLVKGVPEQHTDVTYHLRYPKNGKWVWEAVGPDSTVAMDLRASRSVGVSAKAVKAPVPAPEPVHRAVEAKKERLKLDDAIRIYLTTGKAAEKDWRKHTVQCYTLALRLFTESCKKTALEEIHGDDLRQFKVYLRQQRTSIGKKIDPRTVYNHFNNVVSFLNSHGRKELIPQSEWPDYEEKEVVHYDPEVMGRLLKFADVDETDVLEFFLGVGFRNGEGTHIEWPDIDLLNKEVHVYSKRERFDWRVKDSQQRIIGISDSLAERLAARHERHPGNGLVFGNSKGNPDKHLLRIIKRVALRAGLNCGRCVGTHERKRVSCSTHPVCRKWIIHTLRKTWATFQARIGTPLPTIKDDLGHSSLATTQKYLATEERRSPRRRQQINAAAALVNATLEEAKPTIQ